MSKVKKNIWPKQISVDKRIVKILSQSTYENFPSALKEIITNSYDADASSVTIDVNLDSQEVVIEDNGKGMTEAEFDFLVKIAGKTREKGAKTRSGRLVIGQFGVGFLSSFPFFDNYSIETTCGGSEEVVKASVPCYEYFNEERSIDIDKIDIRGGTYRDVSLKSKHYTRITLKGFTELTSAFFSPSKSIGKRKYSIHSEDGMDKLIWGLTEDLPIKYEDERFDSLVKKYSPNLPFKVVLNGKELKRKTHGKTLLEVNGVERRFEENQYHHQDPVISADDIVTIGRVKFQYFILTDKKSVRPYEARYLKRRNINAGVGRRERFGLGIQRGGARSRLHQLTGEIHFIEGVNDLINVSRDDFVYHEDYEKVVEYMVDILNKHSNQLEAEADYKRNLSTERISNLGFIKPVDETPSSEERQNRLAELERKIEQEVFEFDFGPDAIDKEEKDVTKKNRQEPLEKSSKHYVEKTIEHDGTSYRVLKDDWDFDDDQELYPACKLVDGDLLINSNYPLFKKVKHTDVFIRLHLFLLKHFTDDTIDRSQFEVLSRNVLEQYKDYI